MQEKNLWMNESYDYFSSSLPVVQKFRKNNSVDFHASHPSPLCSRLGDSFAVTVNFEAIINGKLIIQHQEFSRFFLSAFFFLSLQKDICVFKCPSRKEK